MAKSITTETQPATAMAVTVVNDMDWCGWIWVTVSPWIATILLSPPCSTPVAIRRFPAGDEFWHSPENKKFRHCSSFCALQEICWTCVGVHNLKLSRWMNSIKFSQVSSHVRWLHGPVSYNQHTNKQKAGQNKPCTWLRLLTLFLSPSGISLRFGQAYHDADGLWR